MAVTPVWNCRCSVIPLEYSVYLEYGSKSSQSQSPEEVIESIKARYFGEHIDKKKESQYNKIRKRLRKISFR